MLRNKKQRGLFVVVRREGDGKDDRFRWSIYRRKTPLGVKLPSGPSGIAGAKRVAKSLKHGLERSVGLSNHPALLAGYELTEHGIDPVLRRYIHPFLRWGCRRASRRQRVGAEKGVANEQQYHDCG
jgi:hypothetical protein